MNLQVMFSTDGYAFPETFYLGMLKWKFITILPSLDQNVSVFYGSSSWQLRLSLSLSDL